MILFLFFIKQIEVYTGYLACPQTQMYNKSILENSPECPQNISFEMSMRKLVILEKQT